MSDVPVSSARHDASPDDALTAIVGHEGPLLIDLDETLYLQNSTEDFIDSCVPGLAALLLLRVLDVLKPWRWTGGDATRDVWRVRCVSILFPWTWRRWRQRVASLAETHRNTQIVEALSRSRGAVYIVTAGFIPVVTPLIEALGFSSATIIAMRVDTFADRREGKLALSQLALGEDVLSQALVLTDSKDDLPLLDHCAVPLRVIWPAARYRRALSQVYLPGQYLTLIKRPGQRYILRGILQEDFAFWVLASVGVAHFPALHFAGLLALLLSFWAIYERGYVDNDWVAQNYEKDPKLSTAYGVVEVATPRWTPWVWALISGLAAIFLLRWPDSPTPLDLIKWGGVLLATDFGFAMYNRFDKKSRIWLFPGLQFVRTTAFALLVPVGLPASLALGAHILARWVPYYTYRFSGKDWPEAPFFLSRLLFYILLWLTFAFTQGTDKMLTLTALAMLLWNVFRARKDLRKTLSEVTRIDRPNAPKS